jgi:N-acyl-L-homoserine lactone synthetase
MIVYIEAAERQKNQQRIFEYFKLRRKVFCDHLRWVEPRPDGLERDAFDEMDNVYILNVDEYQGNVTGGVRLMPTTGPTLIHDVWRDMLPDPDDFRSPNIWEATRFCVDEASSASRKGSFVNRATLALSLAVMDFGAANGITHVIGVCERKFFDMASAYGADAEIISTKRDTNGVEIGCGIWSTSAELQTLEWARDFVGCRAPVMQRAVA